VRLWSFHPHYLDPKGLVALWREALLAQKVLQGKTQGYRHHPQLLRFQTSARPLELIAFYLSVIHRHSLERGYRFNYNKIGLVPTLVEQIPVTTGQLLYEQNHFYQKAVARSPATASTLNPHLQWNIHPLFKLIKGPIQSFEKPARLEKV